MNLVHCVGKQKSAVHTYSALAVEAHSVGEEAVAETVPPGSVGSSADTQIVAYLSVRECRQVGLHSFVIGVGSLVNIVVTWAVYPLLI